MKKKVIICGAGVGGLSCAHELSKNPEYEIHIFERNSEIGGQARSTINQNKKHTELCWHAISSGYKYFLNILDEVYDEKGFKIISHLKPLNKFIYAFNNYNYIEYQNSFVTDTDNFANGFKKIYGYSIPFLDKLKLIWINFIANSICEKRLKKYDTIKWIDYINVSPKVKRWIVDSTSIYLGMDYSKLSTHFALHFIRNKKETKLLDTSHVFYSLDGPMNEILFYSWQKQLEKQGVIFHLNHNIISFDIKDHTIESIVTKIDDCYCVAKGDIFVNALDSKQLSYLIPISNNMKLFENSRQIQTQVLYYLPHRLQPIGTDPTIIIFPETPWFLMTRIEGDLWDTEYDLLSTGIGMWDVPGLYGKTATECTRNELAIECWAQISQTKHNLKLPHKIPDWDIWFSYQFDENKKEIDTYEPKFSNNVDTLEYRPDFEDKNLYNLYHANAYTQTYMNIFNMESAAEAGCKVSALIQGNKIESNIAPTNWFWKVCRWFDNLLFSIIG